MLHLIESQIKNKPLISWISIIFLIFITLSTLAVPIIRIGFKFSIDYNEGWNVFHSVRAATGKVLYDRKIMEWTIINYPPLSFYIVGILGKVFGSPLLTGRFIALLSLLFVSFGVAILVLEGGGQRYDAVFASFFCIGLFSIYASYYVAMNDPQMLGHLFQIVGLILYIEWRTKRIGLFFVAFLLSLGLFTKHNLIALPLAIMIDVFLQSRKDFIRFTMYFTLIIILFIISVCLISGHDFLNQLFLLESSRTFSLSRLVLKVNDFCKNMQLPLLAVVLLIIFASNRKNINIFLQYFLIAFIFGIYFSGGSGVDVNIFFDTFISISILTGLFLSLFRNKLQMNLNYANLIHCILPLILSLGIVLDAPHKMVRPSTYSMFVKRERIFLNDAIFLSGNAGPALCEDILLCYYAGKPFEYDRFNVSQLILSKKMEEANILERLETGYFTTVQLPRELKKRFLKNATYGPVKFNYSLSDNSMKAVGKYYNLCRYSGGRVFYCFQEQIDTESNSLN